MPPHSPQRIVILGGFGFDNLGDDLILRAALRQLRATLKDVEITVQSNNPRATAAEHKGEVVVFSARSSMVTWDGDKANMLHRDVNACLLCPAGIRRLAETGLN